MTSVAPPDIIWIVSPQASVDLTDFRAQSGDGYAAARSSLQRMMCDYFNNSSGCTTKLGKTICPVESGVVGAKGFKVRWLTPGGGKSGGLRMAVMAYCDARRVVVAGAWMRKEDPKDAELSTAFAASAEK